MLRSVICRGAALVLVVFAMTTTLSAQATVKCYGVSLAGENDGLDDREAPKSAQVDYQGNAWIMLPQAECLRMALPVQTDGTPRRGSIEALGRDQP